MKGKFYIDGKDAFTTYGLFVANGGYTGLISFPSFKDLETNDWKEEDGIEVDLTTPALNTRDFSINFYCKDYYKTIDFIALISDLSYHEFNFAEAGCIRKLRLVSDQKKKIFKQMESFSLTFADDFPMQSYEYISPLFDSSVPHQENYEIDGVPLLNYGVFLLDGSDAEIIKTPAVKKNLLVDISTKSGAIYNGNRVVFQKKDVALKCWMRCRNAETMWRNLNALVYDLTKLTEKTDEDGFTYQDAERVFYVEKYNEEYPCYYNGLKSTKFQILPGGRIWLEFTLTLTFTSFRLGDVEYLLASEAGELIITEDGEFYIDMKSYA